MSLERADNRPLPHPIPRSASNVTSVTSATTKCPARATVTPITPCPRTSRGPPPVPKRAALNVQLLELPRPLPRPRHSPFPLPCPKAASVVCHLRRSHSLHIKPEGPVQQAVYLSPTSVACNRQAESRSSIPSPARARQEVPRLHIPSTARLPRYRLATPPSR